MSYINLLKIREQKPNVLATQNWVWMKNDDVAWECGKHWEDNHHADILKHVNKFDVCIQAGGNMGMYPRLLSDMFRYVYTFEPVGPLFYCLTVNCQKDNIIKFNAALGEEHGMVCIQGFDLNSNNLGVSTTTTDADGYVPTMRIDDLVLKACDLIWLDMEGYEPWALRGGLEIIKKFKPVIMAENGNRKEITDVLEPLGYQIVGTSVADTIFKAT